MKTRADKIAEAEAAGLNFPYPDPPAPGETIEVAPGIHWARLPLPMALDHVNIYLLDDGDGWCVVDTGMRTDVGKEAWEKLLAGVLSGKPVTRIIVTHSHPDHAGLAGWLAEKTDAPMIATRTTFLYARMLQLDRWSELPAAAARYYRSAGYGEAEMARLSTRAKFGFSMVCAPLPLGFQRIAEGDTLRIGDRDWRIVVGHGHAPEHAMLWCEADKLLISGDQVLPRITSNIGVYPTEPDSNPLGDWLESCALLRARLPADLLVLPGHNEPFTGLHQRLTQLIEHHGETLDALYVHLSEPRTAIECFPVLFDRKITDQLLGFATVEAVAHLNYLLDTGRATRSETDGVYHYQRNAT